MRPVEQRYSQTVHQTLNKTEISLREERVMEDYINYIATTNIPKLMTVAEIKTSTKQDPTLQAAIQALRYGRWDTATHKPYVDKCVTETVQNNE